MADDFERMWADLAPVGQSGSSGGYHRTPWTAAELELRAWFVEQATDRGLRLEVDPLGNTAAWWEPEGASGPGVLTGSHLDSVLDGGAFDGPLGVVSALAAVDRLRDRGVVPARPVGVAVFVEEEGSRFGLACLGSRLAVGALTWDAARTLTDRGGVRLDEAVVGAGGEPPADDADLRWDLGRIGCFVELHVEQGRGLADLGSAVGVGSGIWPHGRWRLDVDGRADHAGTTLMEDRADPVLTVAMTALAANKQARLAEGRARATFGRLEVHPNATNAVASRVTAWLDARAEDAPTLDLLVATIERMAAERAERDGTTARLTAESVSPSVVFDADLAARVAGDHAGGDWPVLPTAAGHDAGVLAAAAVPTAMLFVRNPTGVSHSPAEHATVADCLAGVEALADTLERLVG